MSRSSTLILLGILVILAPISGLPETWIKVLLAIFGLAIALIGIALRSAQVREHRQAEAPAPAPASESVEHTGPSSIA